MLGSSGKFLYPDAQTRGEMKGKTCTTCRYWSQMVAQSIGHGMEALCLRDKAPSHSQYTGSKYVCILWAENIYGAWDEPPDYGVRAREAYELAELTEQEEEDYKPPKYSDKGNLLVYLEPTPLRHYRYDVTPVDYNGHSSIGYIVEGMGFEYWFDSYIDLDLEGWYVIEGIHGIYHRGEWGYTDDDEEWHFDLCRRASQTEIETNTLDD